MRQQQLPPSYQALSKKGFVCAFSILSALCSIANASVYSSFNSRNLAFRQPHWGGKRIVLTHDNQRSAGFRRTSICTASLLLDDRLRGGAEETKEKEASKKDDDEEWAELIESETIEVEDSEEAKDADEDQIDDTNEEGADEESDEDVLEDDYDSEEEEEEEEEEADVGSDMEESGEYDEPLVPSPMIQMYSTIGVMMFSKKFDLYNPMIVRMARFAFVGYLVILQIFLLFVRIRAKATNDRTPVTLTNPLTNLVQSQLSGPDNSNAMMKNLASSFLKSESTVLEYDLKQARNMQGGLMFSMGFMWFLHFKMEQMQPLLIQTLTGLINMGYSPLFQAYVLGRNLERPFKNPAMQKFEAPAEDTAAESDETTIDEEATIEEEEVEEEVEGEDGDAKDDDDEEEEQGDSDEDDSE